MKTSGLPGSNVDVVDFSTILSNEILGKIGVLIISNRGRVNTPVFCPTWPDVVEEFGSFSGDMSMLYLYRAIQSGSKPYVVRLAHYSDIEDLSTIEGTKATATLTASGNSAIFIAKNVGSGYNGLKVTTVAAKSGTANLLDITIVLNGSEPQTLYDIKNNPNSTEKAAINAKLKHIDIGTITTLIPVGTVTLASGAQIAANIVDVDFVGSEITNTGFRAFDNTLDIFRIYNFNRPTAVVDQALINYAELRGDIRTHHRTPVGLDAQGMIDYRTGTGSYSHTAFDSWVASIVAGDIDVFDPKDLVTRYVISGIGDVAGLKSVSDQQNGPWIAAAGGQRGVLSNLNGVPYNLGATAKAAKADEVYENGINVIINDTDFGPVYWGNRTLLKDQTKLLKFDNVADLVLYIKRGLKPLVKIQNFNPNDPAMWNEMYRSVRPFILDLQSRRAINPESDSTYGWKWYGDQNADTLSDAKFNKPIDITAGKYKAMFAFVPITATEYINILAAVTNNTAEIIVQ